MTTNNDTAASPPAKTVDLDDIAGLIEADRLLTAEINRLEEAHKALLAELVTARDDTREQIQRRMGNATEARVNGRAVVTWKWSKPGSHLDQKALGKDNPELVKRYTVPSKAARKYVLLDPEEANRG
ncbi:hypothetical protein [Actinomadura sp. DC4]|uniref:hypothetical protein n=1 Tax=Actinomadura sp. DC4 TaxID=3055069 RepID=UPI0025AFCF7A|nr:hypothetical protein [Actinomadura sp. DC4]MDN3356046.1 hypothetical protein [Actinomadura sp. DC4]